MFFGYPMPKMYYLMPLVWIPCLVFLLVGLYKIQKIMKNLRDCIKVPGAFLIYCVMAALAILGEIPLLVAGLNGDLSKTQGYTDYLLAENVIIFVYQALLIVILNILTTSSMESLTKRKNHESGLLSEDSAL